MDTPSSSARTALRSAVTEDHTAFAVLFPELGVDDPIPDLAKFAAEIAPTTIFAEDDAGQVVGYAYYRTLGPTTHLSHIVVAKAARRTGLGRQLILEVAERARAAGSTDLTLNVLPTNAAAIALYESVGLAPVYESISLRVRWSLIDGLDVSEGTRAVREIREEEDARVEAELGLDPGRIHVGRKHEGRVFRMIEHDARATAAAVFDTGFGGSSPFRAPDLAQALSLLRALRPFALAKHETLFVNLENQPETAAALLAWGATFRFKTLFMRGRLVD